MSWDKRATTRRSDAPEPSRQRGVNIVYLGVSENAAREGYGRGATLKVGDSFHLLPGAAITLGSGRLCEVTIESELLSDAHTLVAFVAGDDTTMMLTDLDTERGTWVAGACAKVHFIEPGAEFELAQIYRFRCQPA
jgi:hypothetical protein